jgi:hypothetical protein
VSAITGDGATELEAAAGATITQLAGDANNELTIADNTTINLGGTSTAAAVGKILLTKGQNPGKLTLEGTGSVIYTRTDTTITGTNYGTSIDTIDGTIGTFNGTNDVGKVFQDSGYLIKLTGDDLSLTADTNGPGTNKIASDTVTTGTN